jgi:ABC-type multidrug transport system ATPase subunit
VPAKKRDEDRFQIVTRDLTKRYGQLTAVNQLRLRIPAGAVFGLLGPNGAGKTTTIRMLCGLSRPTGGTALVSGIDVTTEPERVREVMGIVPQGNVLDRDLTLEDNLSYHARLHRMVSSRYGPRIDQVLKLVGLEDRKDDWPLNLSGGMKRRFTIAKALLHEPRILVLDEPTTGLDPQSRRLIWDKLLDLNAEGITVLLTTHHMEEAEELCDVIAIIDGGNIIARGTPGELKNRHGGGRTVVVTFKDGAPGEKALRAMGADDWSVRGRRVTLKAKDPLDLTRRLLTSSEDSIESLHIREASLEEVFLNLTGRGLRE